MKALPPSTMHTGGVLRPAAPWENMESLLARLGDVMSPAERLELQDCIRILQAGTPVSTVAPINADTVKLAKNWLDGNCPGKHGKPTASPDFIYFHPGEIDSLCRAVVDAAAQSATALTYEDGIDAAHDFVKGFAERRKLDGYPMDVDGMLRSGIRALKGARPETKSTGEPK